MSVQLGFSVVELPLPASGTDAGEHGGLWRDFLVQSPSACLFHEPDFLAYHPEDRFRFHHLGIIRDSDLVALLPGGLVSREGGLAFRSPLGASFGGPVLRKDLAASDLLAMIDLLKAHGVKNGWRSIELTPPPMIYRNDRDDSLGYCLFACGFRRESVMLCGAVPLQGEPPLHAFLFRSRNVTKSRAAFRAGVSVLLGGSELLADFETVFNATYQRHGVAPTHTMAEIGDLLRRMPERFRFAIARHDSAPVAGLFLIRMNPTTENAFYICSTPRGNALNAMLALFAWTVDTLADQGIKVLDLGPTSMPDGSLNSGVSFFKEGLGAVGYCRERWVCNLETEG